MSCRVAMVVFAFYPYDRRVRREAEALVEQGMSVDVICLRGAGEARTEMIDGVRVIRLPLMRSRGRRWRYLSEYLTFFLLVFFRLSWLHVRRRYDIVHIHNMPDFLIFAALLPRCTGSTLVLDLHDPMPEVYMAKFSIGDRHPAIRLLQFTERSSIRCASLVFTPNVAFRDLFVQRGCPRDKIHVVMNLPDPKLFHRQSNGEQAPPAPRRDPFVIMYHGLVVQRHGLDTALMALNDLRSQIPSLFFHVYGEGDFVDSFLALVRRLDLQDIVRYHGQVSTEVIVRALPSIDVGLVPNNRTPFTEINLPTRIFEYLCFDKPVVAPRTRGILDYFPPDSLYYFEPGNSRDLAEKILSVWRDAETRQRTIEAGRIIYKKYNWPKEKQKFVEAVTGSLHPEMKNLNRREQVF